MTAAANSTASYAPKAIPPGLDLGYNLLPERKSRRRRGPVRYLDEVAALLERARANLRDATANHAEGRFRIVMTVAYYGAF